jgi:hypothetical protein
MGVTSGLWWVEGVRVQAAGGNLVQRVGVLGSRGGCEDGVAELEARCLLHLAYVMEVIDASGVAPFALPLTGGGTALYVGGKVRAGGTPAGVRGGKGLVAMRAR